MTALSSFLFSCFQAFFSALSRPIPLSRPPFVTNFLRQPVSDLFQFYAAFSLPSRLISFSVTFSLPSRLISFSVIFSLPCCLIPFFSASRLCPALFHFLSHSHFRTALFHFLSHSHFRTALFHFLLHSRLCPVLFSTSFCYFQCIYNTFSAYFRVSSFCPYLLHTPKVFISSSNATLSVDSEVICIHLQ